MEVLVGFFFVKLNISLSIKVFSGKKGMPDTKSKGAQLKTNTAKKPGQPIFLIWLKGFYESETKIN